MQSQIQTFNFNLNTVRISLIDGTEYFCAKDVTYADLFKQKEYEMSFYYNEEANIDHLFDLFNKNEAECEKLIAKNLVEPAYELALSCSNALNLLDARSALSQVERASYILRVRTLVKKVCELVVDK